jgi:NAD(P)H-dependent nitrite reductase small subunit
MLIEICNINDLLNNKGKKFLVEDTEIAIFLVNGNVFALSNICPHQHSSIIHDGFIEDEFVVCPVHGWRFRLCDGKKENGYNGLKSFKTIVENDKVFIEFQKNEFNW